MLQKVLLPFVVVFLLASCSPAAHIRKSAEANVLQSGALRNAHVGISVYDAESNKYLFNYQGDKYFVPASNTKLPTCYAAMKFLGDSLPGLIVTDLGDSLLLIPTGDPTLLHADFAQQPVLDFLKQTKKPLIGFTANWEDSGWGNGWSWNDYTATYMAERSALPVYGNVVTFSGNAGALQVIPNSLLQNGSVKTKGSGFVSDVDRDYRNNDFTLTMNGRVSRAVEAPFVPGPQLSWQLLADTLHKAIRVAEHKSDAVGTSYIIHSQPLDSMLKRMMHRSDNFYAEQSLLMVSQKLLGVMNDRKVIDTLMQLLYNDLPQRPRWVDGSGLSRYNLFSPQDFVTILDKMRNDFGMERMKEILPTGNDGTLTNYYRTETGFIFAKTGTLSGVVSISGYLYSQKNKLLIFSVLVNNHNTSATEVRRAVEKFLQDLRARY